MYRLCQGGAIRTVLSAALPVLCLSRRYQRSAPTRSRSSTWQEKTETFEARQREVQAEAIRAAQRRAQYTGKSPTSSSSSSEPLLFKKASSSNDASASGETSSSATAASKVFSRLTRPATGLWTFLRGGNAGRYSQPMNPLLDGNLWETQSAFDPETRSAQRLVTALRDMRQRNAKRRAPATVQMAGEQRDEILRRYAATKWYGPLYKPFSNIKERSIRWTNRLLHLGMGVLLFSFLCVVAYSYYSEVEIVSKLSPQDRRDYTHMVLGMRYSDIVKVGQEALKEEDPLEALPPEVRLRIVIDACRAKGWQEMDWDVELRKMHPQTAWEEWDYQHGLYWLLMRAGRAITGGGPSVFNDRVLMINDAAEDEAAAQMEKERFVELEPTALPKLTKRGFFS